MFFKRKQLKVGFILDLHLGHNPFDAKHVSAEDMREAYDSSLDAQLAHLHAKKCDAVVFGGDTFDTPHPDNEDIALLLQAIARYPSMTYYFILGNHEIESNRIHALKALQVISTISKLTIHVIKDYDSHKINGFPVTFLSYPNVEPYFEGDPGLIVMHNEFRGAKRDNGSIFEKGADFDFDEVERCNQLYVSGHLHTYQAIGCQVDGYVEAGAKRMSSGRIYFGRIGGMRHDAGEFNTAGIVTMTKEKGRYVYTVSTYNLQPRWIIQSKRYIDARDFQDHMEYLDNSGVPDYLISIRIKADSPYIPPAETVQKFKYLSVESKKSAYDELQEEMQGEETRQTKDLSTYMNDWLQRISSARLRGFSLDRFELLRKKIGG